MSRLKAPPLAQRALGLVHPCFINLDTLDGRRVDSNFLKICYIIEQTLRTSLEMYIRTSFLSESKSEILSFLGNHEQHVAPLPEEFPPWSWHICCIVQLLRNCFSPPYGAAMYCTE